MRLIALWQSAESGFSTKRVDQLVSVAADGKLRDGSPASKEFREFLSIVPPEFLDRYASECLGAEKFSDGGKVLQDIINEVGRRLDFEVENGLYAGKVGEIGFDGLWLGKDRSAIIVEVKTTDAYSINLDTIATYRRRLAENGKIDVEKSSILIVVGREDTGSWEAQVRGSRHAWDVRLISVQALLRLMTIKHDLDDPRVIEKIRAVLRPREFTKVDEIVDLVFTTAADVKKETEIVDEDDEDDETEVTPSKKWEERTPKFIPTNFRDAIAERLSKAWNIPLVRRSFAHFSNTDQSRGVYCLNSRTHRRAGRVYYWFAFHPHQLEALKKHKAAFVALGCGSVERVFVIPMEKIEPWLNDMWTTTRGERMYWHIKLAEQPEGTVLLRNKTNKAVPLKGFLLPPAS